MDITFQISLFVDKPKKIIRVGRQPGLNGQGSEKALLWLLESLVNINRIQMRQNRIPRLYKSGIRYQREQSEIWYDAPTLLRQLVGDCEDLACYRVAELRNDGKRASPYIRFTPMPSGDRLYHVLVLRPSGLEDPSRILGMGAEGSP